MPRGRKEGTKFALISFAPAPPTLIQTSPVHTCSVSLRESLMAASHSISHLSTLPIESLGLKLFLKGT